ncbi:MAG: leucine-rich repeat protein, partial [Bacilli bacterium]|nr:leucine-rich repeat protein [Bacilli bacterium]
MKKSIKKLLVLSSLVLTAASAVACSGQKPGSKPAMSSEPVSSVPTSSSSSSSNSSMSSSEELSNNHYEGIGQPPAGLGRNGDTFTDTSTGDVYTKQGGVWVKTSSGQRNNYSGEGDPNPALGENGDKYTDTLNGAVWEKQGGVWIKIQAGDTTYVVTFNLDGGYFATDGSTTYPDQIVREGRWIKAPSVDPVKDHCTFLGWYAEGSQEPWNFVGGAVYGPVNLIARWNVNQNEKIIVTVDPCNGQPTYTHETFVGDYYYPTIPTREGFSFVGWFVKSTQEKYNGYIDGSFAGETLEAHWEKANFNFKFQVEANDEITITGLLDINTVTVTIPAYIGGRKVTKISNSAFNYRTSLVSVNLPATIKELSGQAFAGAYKVNEVNIDSNNLNFVSINGIVFSKSKDVLVYYPIRANQNYTVPNTVKKIGDYAFYDHKDMGLKSINLNEGLEEIGAYAFARNELLASITFPSTLKKIGKAAFYGPSVASDEDDYISPQGTIVSYTWNEGLEEIGEMAFANQYIKDTLKLPNTVKTIGEYAFVNCNAITKVIFPRDLESLGDNAFAAATGVLSADIADGNTHFKVRDNVLYTYDMTELVYCPSGRTEEITIPEGVTKLRQYAFYMVDELQTYNFPSTLKEIGHDCFAHTYGLRSFTIPNSVTTIGEDLFDR